MLFIKIFRCCRPDFNRDSGKLLSDDLKKENIMWCQPRRDSFGRVAPDTCKPHFFPSQDQPTGGLTLLSIYISALLRGPFTSYIIQYYEDYQGVV